MNLKTKIPKTTVFVDGGKIMNNDFNSEYKGFAYIYDALTDDVEYEKRAAYAEMLFEKYMDGMPKLVCDLACGTGTICSILDGRGYDMIGIDGSEDMLCVASQKTLGKNVLYINSDITDFELYGTVDAMLCMLDSINYLTDDGDLDKLFALVKNYLNKGGLFVFDINTPYKYSKILADNVYAYEKDNIFYIWENDFDGEYCDFYLNFFVKQNDGKYKRISEVHTQKMYTIDCISDKILSAGLTLLAVFDDLSLKMPENNSQRVIFVVKNC